MAIGTIPTTASVADAPEPEGLYEVVEGRIVEKPPMGALEVWIAARLVEALVLFVGAGQQGRVVPEMLFVLDRERGRNRRPDVAYVSNARWPMSRRPPRSAAWDVIPDLAVEIISPNNLADDDMEKLDEYFRSGVGLVWIIYPGQSRVYVYDSPTSVRILQRDDELDGGAVLPGFRLGLSAIFEDEAEPPSQV